MKIVITGGSGSVGTAVYTTMLETTTWDLVLVDLKPPAIPLNNPRITYINKDLLVYQNFVDALKGADGLIHLAGYPNPFLVHASATHNTNVSLSYNALLAAAEAGVKHVVLASSVNAIGGCYSPETTYDYLPVDEVHPMRCSDPYSLSKYIAERQADAVALGHPDMSIITFRFHHVVPEKKDLSSAVPQAKMDLWGYVLDKEAARACILAMQVEWKGHEVIYIVGDEHCAGEKWTTVELIRHFYPGVEIRADKSRPYQALYRCDKAETLLGWRHDGKLPQQTRSHSPVRPPREDTGGCIIS